ncbi:MAG: undecaprenyl-diphosphate phosphatase [Candidatus Hydrogenedentota bacterium]
MDYLVAALLAVIEGVTEFLPVSSTGHLIIADEFLSLSESESFNNTFIVVIQLPAILAVVAYFWTSLWPWGAGLAERRKRFGLWSRIVAAFAPAAGLGFLFDDILERYLFAPVPVAIALFVGGLVIILLERRGPRPRIHSLTELTFPIAIGIGLFQCLAMFPGASRSAATIIGAMILGLTRPAAAEFSFFLAIPTMLGATSLKIAKNGLGFTNHEWALIATGAIVSFVVAYAVVAAFMKYIQRRDFAIFGYYRMALAVLVLLIFAL